MPEGRHSAPKGHTPRTSSSSSRSLANEQRLLALGSAVDEKSGVTRKPKKNKRRRRRTVGTIALVLALLLAGTVGGFYFYFESKWNAIPKQTYKYEKGIPPSGAINILEIGSDSRAGLSAAIGKEVGAGSVSGARSDSLKIIHIDPSTDSVETLSIPRDTMIHVPDASLGVGTYNRINSVYGGGVNELIKTIETNFGIPINYTIQVSFGGLIGVANALGGVYLNFPYQTRDQMSGLRVLHPGCTVVSGFQALAFVRSRHYQYRINGVWHYDGLSDWSRIQRQDVFVKGLMQAGERAYNPIDILSTLSAVPAGIVLDTRLSQGVLAGLAWHYRHFNSAQLKAYTLPDYPVQLGSLGDVLIPEQPASQQMLVSIFGKGLSAVSAADAPPGTTLQPNPPPYVPINSVAPAGNTTTTTVKHTGSTVTTTTKPSSTKTTIPLETQVYQENFNPTPCLPK